MKKFLLHMTLLTSVAFAQEYKSFGGVWLGQTEYDDGETPSLNVGSFFFARAPFIKGLHFGYAVSANTQIALANQYDVTNDTFISLAGVGVHVPLEANFAYVIGGEKFRAWAGGGLSVSVTQVTLNMAISYYSLGVTCTADVSGDTELVPGFQLFGGGEFIFGELPTIGGVWGVFGQIKYMYVNEIDMKVSGNVECVGSGGTTSTTNINQNIDIDLSNTSVVVGISYHF